MTGSSSANSGAELVHALRWPLVLLIVAILAFLLYRDTLRQANRTAAAVAEIAGSAAERAQGLAAGFLSGDLTQTFLSAIPQVTAVRAGRLEVAEAKITETLTRRDERRILWDVVSLGTTVSEVKVPVTYRYHLLLADPWQVEVAGRVVIVHAPELRPSLPPAIHTDGLEKRVDADWLRFDAEDRLAELERGLTPQLEAYAGDERHLALVREAARRTIGEFVRTWLLAEQQWGEQGVRQIVVVFPNEALSPDETTAGGEGPIVGGPATVPEG